MKGNKELIEALFLFLFNRNEDGVVFLEAFLRVFSRLKAKKRSWVKLKSPRRSGNEEFFLVTRQLQVTQLLKREMRSAMKQTCFFAFTIPKNIFLSQLFIYRKQIKNQKTKYNEKEHGINRQSYTYHCRYRIDGSIFYKHYYGNVGYYCNCGFCNFLSHQCNQFLSPLYSIWDKYLQEKMS